MNTLVGGGDAELMSASDVGGIQEKREGERLGGDAEEAGERYEEEAEGD